MSELTSYVVWDKVTRWFHWLNVLCFSGLVVVGLVILNASDLGVNNAGKVTLKTIHTLLGYLFAVNLSWRIVWGFIGNRYARWGAILPGGVGYLYALRDSIKALVNHQPEKYLGHNPIGRLSVALMLLLMAIQAITGLILSGTDLFYPPIGHWIAEWVAAVDVNPALLEPYTPTQYDTVNYEIMRSYRKPVGVVHLYTFYLLLATVILHVVAVIMAELRDGGGIISAMITGRKIFNERPIDDDTHD